MDLNHLATELSEQQLFNQDYNKHSVLGVSKPKTVGQPFLLKQKTPSKGILLIHGLMAAPEEVRLWAEYLFEQGYTVYAVRMVGHGTSAKDLSARKYQEWCTSIERGECILRQHCKDIVIAGFSTGAAVALHQVIEFPEKYVGIISISAPLKFKKKSAYLAGVVNNWNVFCSYMGLKLWTKEYVTNHADNPHINYLQCPVSSIVQIKKMMKKVRGKLSDVTIPCLLIHGGQDPKVDVQSSRDIYQAIASKKKEYHEVTFDLHGIIHGSISTEVFETVGVFLRDIFKKGS